MQLDYGYAAMLVAYLVIVTGIGFWGYRKGRGSLAAFSVADSKMGTVLATGTFSATFLSAITLLGGVGYASQNGWSFLLFIPLGVAVGWILLALFAPYLKRSGCTTVPELMEVRYGSTGLRVWLAFIIIILYAVTLVAQLLGVSILLETVVGLPAFWAVILIGATFTAYTMAGGLLSVARTDFFQFVMICLGVVVTGVYVLANWGGEILTLGGDVRPELGAFSGVVGGWGDVVAWVLVWGLGVPAQSYYLQRFYASKDTITARSMVGYGAALMTVVYVFVTLIGLAAAIAVPSDSLGDAALPYLMKEVIGGPVAVLLLGGLIAGVQSTTDSLLHIVGTYASADMYGKLRPDAPERTLLRVARGVTLVFGLAVTGLAAYMTIGTFPLIALIAAVSWGGMAAAVAVPVFAGVAWKGATRAGAAASTIGGTVMAIVGFALKQAGVTELHEIYFGVGTALVLMVLVSRFTKASPTEDRRRVEFFSGLDLARRTSPDFRS